MINQQLKTPVVFIIFKRPNTTEKVFEAIRKAKPPKLLVIGDGPRTDRPGEAEKCEATREIIQRVDWNCEVLTNYSEVNLGCNKRVSSGLDWVFEQVEEAIILEDDCLPHPTFFPFCEELLEKYRNDSRVISISGQNVQLGRKRTKYSYYFSRYNHCWGWATWRRAWQHYDIHMKLWAEVKDSGYLKDILKDPGAVKFWTNYFQKTYENRLDSWAVRWTFASWVQNGISILSNTNLISNIGFGLEATHTLTENPFANLPVEAVDFPLNHPPFMIRDDVADHFTQNTLYDPNLKLRIKRKIKKLKNIPTRLSKSLASEN
ncbi:methyltransferase FkbM [Nostoc sp. NIES-4103]|nr:methyltransferase FkbM [Nostoc sp. NIES-4103]